MQLLQARLSHHMWMGEISFPFVNRYDLCNGNNHGEDPIEKGYIYSDGKPISAMGGQLTSEAVARLKNNGFWSICILRAFPTLSPRRLARIIMDGIHKHHIFNLKGRKRQNDEQKDDFIIILRTINSDYLNRMYS